MRKRNQLTMMVAAFAATIFNSAIVFAQDSNTSSNVFGAWEVVCATNAGTKSCALLQQQATRDAAGNRQRLLALELRPDGDNVSGMAILPFGLDLAKGIRLSISATSAGQIIPFKTCLPVGCLVDLSFGPDSVKALSSAERLTINITPLQQGGVGELSIMLEGFSEALQAARSGVVQ